MWKTKILEWLEYTLSAFKTKNSLLPMAKKLDTAAIKCLREIEKTDSCIDILMNPDISQFFFSPYATALHYHQSILSATLSKYALSNLSLTRPQLESALIFLYFIDSQTSDELHKKVESYRDWVVVKMYQNAKRSNEFEFLNHLSTHDDYMEKVEHNYETIKEKYSDKEYELKRLNRASFIPNKREVARHYNIEGLFLHVQSEGSANIHVADVSDRVSYEINDEGISYKLNNNSDDSFWSLMISNLIQATLITDLVKNH